MKLLDQSILIQKTKGVDNLFISTFSDTDVLRAAAICCSSPYNLQRGTIVMEVILIMPTTPEGKAKLSKELAKFHAEQALKMVQKLPLSTEQKLELIDEVVKSVRSKQ